MFNKVYLQGNIVSDIELKTSKSGTVYSKNSIAVSHMENGNKVTEYFDIVLFNKTAGSFNSHFSKGDNIIIEGILKQEKWEKEDKKFSRVLVYVDNLIYTFNRKEKKNKITTDDKETKTATQNTSEILKEEIDDQDVPF